MKAFKVFLVHVKVSFSHNWVNLTVRAGFKRLWEARDKLRVLGQSECQRCDARENAPVWRFSCV